MDGGVMKKKPSRFSVPTVLQNRRACGLPPMQFFMEEKDKGVMLYCNG
jgi:hypothetical protein